MVIWEQAAHRVVPEFFRIPDATYQRYGKKLGCAGMSRQIELNIGKDLQFIRVNGTLVGGCIGLILYLLSQLPALFPLGNF
ncbi:inner membrane protein [Escherichia coli]|uniref:Inner membrane protein n=1 Tax=Escherichia coli TaxID=562 RepID=A0A377DE88_ECOLX|nr:inner membrane protein [Escherichia coli]